MHKSYLEFGYHVEDLLFEGLTINSVGGMVGLCLTVAFFTFSYEGVKTLRQRYASSLKRTGSDGNSLAMQLGSDARSERAMLVEMDNLPSDGWKRVKIHVIQAALYMAQVTMGYILMLIIMSYNGWLAITVFLTAGLSYYFFSTFVLYRPMVIPIEILTPDEYN